jgi:PAS domain S-box-containing protein
MFPITHDSNILKSFLMNNLLTEKLMFKQYSQQFKRLKSIYILLLSSWTILIIGLCGWNCWQSYKSVMQIVRSSARDTFSRDLVYRRWASNKGGVYAPMDNETPPNPYLSDFSDRDITTPSGKKLTLMNPAYMIRQVHELGKSQYSLRGHITSLDPIRPENAADSWEKNALMTFQKGVKEVSSIETLDKEPYFRLMRPIITEKPCLKCHEKQGYKVGDIRGGLSISVPWLPSHKLLIEHLKTIVIGYSGILIAGLLLIHTGYKKLNHHLLKRTQAENKLRVSEIYYKTLINSTPDIIIKFNRLLKHTFVNPPIISLYGKNPEECIGKTHRELGFTEVQSAFWEYNIESVFEHFEPIEVIQQFNYIEVEKIFNIRLIPVFNEGYDDFVLCIARDISEQIQLEENYKLMFMSMLNGFAEHEIICDEDNNPIDYRFITVNPAFERKMGLRAKEIVGKTVKEIFPKTERVWIERYGTVALTGEPVHFEDYFHQLGKFFEVTAYQTKPYYFACIIKDITERKSYKMEIQKKTALNQILLDSLPCIVMLSKVETHEVVSTNAAGNKAGIIIGEKCFKTWRKRDNPCSWCLASKVIETGKPQHLEIEVDKVIWDTHWYPINDEIYLHYCFDITEKKRLEEKTLQTSKLEVVGQLAGGVAHDLNNMLTPILGYSELLITKLDKGDPLREIVSNIINSADRARKLVQQLLTFARKQTIEMKTLDINTLIINCIEMLRGTLRENVIIKTNLAPKINSISGDECQIEQILLNLAVNAQDAMPDGGTLVIETENVIIDYEDIIDHPNLQTGSYALIKISDTGSGMDSETRQKIFEPFFTTKDIGKGTGLGLAMVYGIIKKHKGYIDVQSEPGIGTTFSLYFPKVYEQYKFDSFESTILKSNNGKETLLVVEDQDDVRNLLNTILTENGYSVISACDGETAVKMAESYDDNINLLLTDVVMTGMNGHSTYERIMQKNLHIKVLFMSGYDKEVVSHQGVIDEGINFIQKPFSLDDLTRKIREVLDH